MPPRARTRARKRPPPAEPAGPRRRIPKQARARERVGRILDAARLELEVRPVAEITIEGIAARARVPVGSVYQYFSSKVALLAAVAEAVMDETDAESARQLAETRALPWREAVDRVVEATFGFLRARPDYRMLLRSIRFTAEFAAVSAASNDRMAGLMALHPAFGRAGLGREKALVICRTLITAANALQDRALAEEPPDFDELVEETKRLAKGYLGTYVG
jgi:AcrR family transcriptional regulator